MISNTLHYFITYRKHNLDSKSNNLDLLCGPVMSVSVAFISFAKKLAIDFCQVFFSVTEDIILVEFIK